MRKSILAAALLSLALLPGFAQAGGGTPSQLTITGTEITDDGEYEIFGDVNSPSKKCIKDRAIEMFVKKKNDEVKVLDTDTTSTRGAWAGMLHKNDPLGELFVRVKRSQVGDTTCAPDKELVVF